ncbi:hypothetical protein LCI18_009230 [Fusarium solani-melongenae]|uniref:Uncharacterized protein n=1 Tax=Fusarium solani subsp. cucurbitae TaxID=2747967 RepID=A0ACD3ZAQ1_FUSSC|nr:hypothetical protein LCI18_009230 [Fusarium solani-melongenae]
MEGEQMATARGRSKKRITNMSACHGWQKRKIRCDGGIPSCTHCTKRKIPYDYTERRRRGLGKSKKYIQTLEERLSKVESSLEQSASVQPSQERTAISQSPDLDVGGHSNETEGDLAGLPGSASTDSQGVPTPVLGAPSSIILSRRTQHTPQTAFEHPGAPTGIMESLEITDDTDFRVSNSQHSQRHSVPLPILPGSRSDVNLFRSQLDPSGFQRQIAPLHSQPLRQSFVTGALDDVNVFHPLFTLTSLSELLQQQFLSGPRNCDDSPVRWAITNAFIATAIQWKTEHGAYFKNAFSLFPELLIRGNDISTCQALLCMAIFMYGTSDARTTSSLSSSVVRVLQAVGLHTRCCYEKLDPITAEQHRRVFWIAYILDSDQMMKQGLPSTFGNEDVELPAMNPPDGLGDYTLLGTQKKINVLGYMAGLAMIQSRISITLYSKQALKMNSTELQRAVAELNSQLDMWKMDLPLEIRPTCGGPTGSSQLEMPVLLLTLIYYTTSGRINMASNRLQLSNDHIKLVHRVQPLQPGQLSDSYKRFNKMNRQMYHAVYAVITLLRTILQSPSGSQGQTDLSLITGFVRVLETLQVNHGCDVGNLLHGCTRIEEIAQNVVISHGITAESQSLTADTYLGLEKERHLRMYQKLCSSADHMQIVHGLMGNVPTLCSEAMNVFSEILGISCGWKDTYGPFAPESLKPENFDFKFGFP